MNIAIYTLTRDRLQYTKDCFAALREKAGIDPDCLDHYIIDNGSTDGSKDWIYCTYCNQWPKGTWVRGDLTENVGISAGSNMALKCIMVNSKFRDYGLIVKFDNDCMIQSPDILAEFARIYSECKEAERWVLSPRVEGINNQPRRVRQHTLAGHEIGVTAIVGGLFHVVPTPIYRKFMEAGGYDETLPKAWGQDDCFCDWLARNGYAKGYVEDLVVEHYETTTGQAKRWPAYFERKWKEEKI